jgi:hypothetical protein
MSDPFFDVDRAAGTYPPKGFGWLDEDKQQERILHYFKIGYRDPWMYEYAARFGMKLPAEYQPYQG